jgi:cytochrome c55X
MGKEAQASFPFFSYVSSGKQRKTGMKHIITMLFAPVFLSCLFTVVAAAPDTQRQAELLYLLKHDCGSCHGMTRKGGLGPPLLPEALSDRPQLLLVNTVLDGRSGTPMPPWRGQLTEPEAQWLVEVLRRGEGL